MNAKREVLSLIKSFSYAFKGIVYCVKNERNMRIHLSAVVLVSLFSFFYRVTSTEYILLMICMGLVVSAEMVNTALETLTNLESPSYNRLARIAKDVAAGAVLVAAIMAIVVGGVIFLKFDRLFETLAVISSTPLYWGSFLVLIALAVWFIFWGTQLFGEPKTKVYHIHNK